MCIYIYAYVYVYIYIYMYTQIYTYPTLTMAGTHHSHHSSYAKMAKQPSVLYSTPSPPWSRVYKYACQATPATPCDSLVRNHCLIMSNPACMYWHWPTCGYVYTLYDAIYALINIYTCIYIYSHNEVDRTWWYSKMISL